MTRLQRMQLTRLNTQRRPLRSLRSRWLYAGFGNDGLVNELLLMCDYALILHRERANMKRRRIAGPIGAGKPRVTAAESLALSCGRLYGHDVAADVNKEFTDAAAR